MNDNANKRRIVITLDSGRTDAADIGRLARLAQRLDAELEGVFVEDTDLLRIASLSFTREFHPTTQHVERVQPARMHRELRVLARHAERDLARCAEQQGVRWSFRVWRGSIGRELLSSVEADVVALTRLGAVEAYPIHRWTTNRITVCFDGSPGAGRALRMAADLANDVGHAALQVLVEGSTGAPPDELRRQVEEGVVGYGVEVHYRALSGRSLTDLVQVLHDPPSAVLIMQRDNRLLDGASLRAALARLRCTLLLVR